MGNAGAGDSRHPSSISFLMPVLAGVLIGIAGFLIKIVMSKVELTSSFILIILKNPYSYVAGLLGLAGFLLFQKSLHKGKVSTTTPVMNGLSILVPVVLALLFLSETVSTAKIIGIALIVVGVAGLRG